MRFFLAYLKQLRAMLIAFSVFCLIFAAAFALYHLPLAAVGYPALLCGLLGLGMLMANFGKAYGKHRILRELPRHTAEELEQMLPAKHTTEDEDYQESLRHLCKEQAAMAREMELHYLDMVDYYTVWVHQIKTPIASMRLHLQNEDSPLSRKLSTDLFRIEQYVEMVLMFLRLDSSETDYVFAEYDLDDIVRQAVKKYAGEFIERKLRLVYQPLNVRVVTDEKWLSFVVEQVLSNALKYTPNGSISITMEHPKTLCIRDTGIGIAPEDLPRIFDKGYTGCHGREQKRASGLGLYLCRRTCRNLGHSISAVSKPDCGTEIRLDFQQKSVQLE